MRRALKVTMGADTYHDFRPACAVGVMRALRSSCRHDEFDMMIQSVWWRGESTEGFVTICTVLMSLVVVLSS